MGKYMNENRKSKLLIGGLFVALVGIVTVFFVLNRPRDAREGGSAALRPAPAFSHPDKAGKLRGLADFKGRVVLIHFWASWCPPCLDELAPMLEFGKTLDPQKTALIFVSLDANWEDAAKVLPGGEWPPHIVSVLDTSTKTAEHYGSYQYPETFLISRDGKITTKWLGPQNWKLELYRQAVQTLY